MFVRKKRNRSGTVSVQVIDKSNGYRVVKSMGSSDDPREIQRLMELAELFIARQQGQFSLFPEEHRDRAVIADFVEHLSNASIRTVGPELVFGRLFDEIGFDAIPEQLFRDIVVARLVYPSSKLKMIDYLYRYQGKTMSVQEVYRFLDRLNECHAVQAKQIAYRHTKKLLKRYRFGKPVVVADAAMLSKDNLDALDRAKFPFIVAARLRNESEAMQETILSRCHDLDDGASVAIGHEQHRRLIVSYSDQRAKKDRHNRQRGLQRLHKRIGSGRMTKEQLNNRGYNKFLKLTG